MGDRDGEDVACCKGARQHGVSVWSRGRDSGAVREAQHRSAHSKPRTNNYVGNSMHDAGQLRVIAAEARMKLRRRACDSSSRRQTAALCRGLCLCIRGQRMHARKHGSAVAWTYSVPARVVARRGACADIPAVAACVYGATATAGMSPTAVGLAWFWAEMYL